MSVHALQSRRSQRRKKVDDTRTPVRSTIDSLPSLVERRDLVALANRPSRWDCSSRGHGVPF